MELIVPSVGPFLPFIISLGLLIGAVIYLLVRSKKSKSYATKSAIIGASSFVIILVTLVAVAALAFSVFVLWLALQAM